ncbi:MAG: hypothetical protein ACLVIY_03110 [Anaerobutyricum soehngenii]
MISQGAVLVRSSEDIAWILLVKRENRKCKAEYGCKQEREFSKAKIFVRIKMKKSIFNLLDEIHPMTFENLLENSGFSAFELQHILMKFELKNIIYQIEQNVYLRKV